jgi:cation:H+ antiporter
MTEEYSLVAIAFIGTVGSLALLLTASEMMVRALSLLGQRLALSPRTLGLLVAVGADSPEISTAIVALVSGSQQIGLGVVEGSNIYNLAGLLGLSALIAGPLYHDRRRAAHDGMSSLVLTCLLVVLVLLPIARIPLALALIVLFVLYLVTPRYNDSMNGSEGRVLWPLMLALLATAAVVGMSVLLVDSAVLLIHQVHIPDYVIGVIVLPVATSLPNTWGALSLARRQLGDAVITTTFTSNSINLSLGIAVPSLFIRLQPTVVEQTFDGPYLLGMTAVTFALLLTTSRLDRREGMLVIALYLTFLVIRLLIAG